MTMTGKLQITTPTPTEVVMTRVVDAPRTLVWEAWTSPALLPKWMLGPEGWTMPVCEVDLRPGGAWRFVWRMADGQQMEMVGRYVEVEAPGRLVSTERWGPEWPETINTLTLTEKAGKTTVVQTVRYPSKEARDAALKTGMAEGMGQGFDRLERLLAG